MRRQWIALVVLVVAPFALEPSDAPSTSPPDARARPPDAAPASTPLAAPDTAPATAPWSGRVVADNGSAVPNATAFWTTARLAQGPDGWPKFAAERAVATRTGDDGRFVLPSPDATQRLRVEAPGFYPWEGGFKPDVTLVARENVTAIAHRGAAAYAPENTLAAFDVAWALGADRVEVDVRLTADDRLVAIHDALVDRTTDGTGAVAAMTLAVIQALDAGSWFHDDYAGTRVPSLHEVLAWSNATGVPLLIEVKEEPPRSALALEKVLEALSEWQFLRWDAWVASFDPVPGHSCAWANRYDCGWILPTEPDQREAALATATASNVPFIVVPVHYVDEAFMNATHQQGIDVLAYTANAVETQERLLALGVAGIITDRPDRLVALLAH